MPAAFFDIVGTCFSYEAAEKAVELRLGKKLAQYGLSPKLFFHFWLVTVERDSAFMVFTERPKDTNVDRWRADLPRVLFQSGVPPEDIQGFYTEEDLDYILDEYLWGLTPRPGFASMLESLKAGGIDFYACSGAKPERVKTYFRKAGLEIAADKIWDVAKIVGAHKPQLATYGTLYEEFSKKLPGEPLIFGASHAWDLAGAKARGFNTAYTLEYEHYECTGMWGKHDIVCADLAELGRAIVERFGQK